MVEIFDTIAKLQSNGGIMVGIVWAIVEIRRLRSDFNRHEHDANGKPFVKMQGQK